MSLDAITIAGFSAKLLVHSYDDPKPTPTFHREMWDLCCSDIRYVAIAAPRSHAKSTAVTHAYVLASVLFREHDFVVVISDTETQAIDFLHDLRVEFQENAALRETFGLWKVVKDAQTDIVVQMHDGHQFRIIAKGSEQKLRGLKWRGRRPNLIVGDDLENDEIVLNRDRRDRFKKWVYGAVLPSLSDKGRARFVGTILHMDSFLETHMPDAKHPATVNTPLSEKFFVPGEMWASIRYRAHDDTFAHLLWPEKFSQQRLEAIRKDYVNRGFPEVYSQEYLNYPIDETRAFFRREDFLDIREEDTHKRKRYYAAADLAISQKESADYTVIAVASLDQDGFLQVEDIRKGRWDAMGIIDEMFSVQQRYKPELFTVETGAIEKSLGPFLKSQMLAKGVFMNLNLMTPTKDKQSRAMSLQARMRMGSVRFDKDAHWFAGLQSEMLRFPRDVHDDQVDALAWIGLTLDQLIEPATLREIEDEYYESIADNPLGRSVLTGY